MFLPTHMKTWQPEHMRVTPMRRCHFCASGPHRMGALIHVLELPMRYHFCKASCMQTWQQTRHDDAVVAWLKLSAGKRAEILKTYQDEQTKAEDCGPGADLRGVDHMEVPMHQSL